MNPQVTLALLAKYTDLSATDAEKIASELALGIQPTSYKHAEQLVDRLATTAKTSKRRSLTT